MARRLLIVDDEETLTFSLYQSFILSKKDYEVVTAASGEEALDKMNENPFDLLITDIFMPGINGIEFVNTLTLFFIIISKLSSLLFHSINFFISQSRGCFNPDLLFFTGAFIFGRNM